jgi:hypothetical protein
MADFRNPADVSDAVYRVVHDFGVMKLAALTGTSPGTISNKANPNEQTHHKPTLADGIVWSLLTGDDRIAEAFCQTLGGVFVPLRDQAQQSDAALLDLILERDASLGVFASTVGRALADGDVTKAEFDLITADAYALCADVLTLMYRLGGMVRG